MNKTISNHGYTIQETLFPYLKEALGPLSEKQQQRVTVVEMSRISDFIRCRFGGVGRPAKSRQGIAISYVAKAVYNMPTTAMLIDRLKSDIVVRRLCGFERVCDIPSESTFSRALEDVANTELAEYVHAAFIKRYHSERLEGHISRDASESEAREKALKPPTVAKLPKKRGPSQKGGHASREASKTP